MVGNRNNNKCSYLDFVITKQFNKALIFYIEYCPIGPRYIPKLVCDGMQASYLFIVCKLLIFNIILF